MEKPYKIYLIICSILMDIDSLRKYQDNEIALLILEDIRGKLKEVLKTL